MCRPGPHNSNYEERGKYCKYASIPSTSIQEVNCMDRETRDNRPPSKLQSAIYYVLDGDQNGIFRTRKPLLHPACERKAWNCTEYLVQERTDEIHILKDEYYPIHYAASNDLKFLELLFDAGADTTVRTCKQMTLLHVVLLVAHKSAEDTIATIRLLLDNGCKELINAPDSLGNTPLHALIVRYTLEEAQYGYDKWNKWDVVR